jgi:hypothetical protein
MKFFILHFGDRQKGCTWIEALLQAENLAPEQDDVPVSLEGKVKAVNITKSRPSLFLGIQIFQKKVHPYSICIITHQY